MAICCCLLGISQNTPQDNLIQSSYIRPLKIVDKGNNHYFIDFGKDAFGVLQWRSKFPFSDTVVIHLGEKLSDENTIDRMPPGTIRYQKTMLPSLNTDELTTIKLRSDGRNDRYPAIILPDTLGRVMPFRYVEIENLTIPISEVEIWQKSYHARFEDDASYFYTSDTILNQIWDLCKYTIKATGFCGKYIDGDRERIPYEADAFINQLSHYAVDAEYEMARQTNAYFIDHPTWPTEWLLHTVMLFYYDYLYSGHTEELSKYYDQLKSKTLMDLAGEDALISSRSSKMTKELMQKVGFEMKYTGRPIEDIVDWPQAERDGYEMTKVNTVVNAFYYYNLKLMAEIAEVLGKKQEADDFREKSEVLKTVFNQKLLDTATGIYVDGVGSHHSSLHANMFPLAFGLVPEANKDKVVAFIKSRGMACSVYGAQYLLEALYLAGESEYAYHLMTDTVGDRNWWNMIRCGSTMTLEAWDIKYKPNLDWNHAWATAPLNIITRYMWGITPSRPGFEKVCIQPQMADFEQAKIKVPTPKGSILAEYRKTSKGGVYDIVLPEGMEAEFLPTFIDARILKLNQKRQKGSTILLQKGSNHIELE